MNQVLLALSNRKRSRSSSPPIGFLGTHGHEIVVKHEYHAQVSTAGNNETDDDDFVEQPVAMSRPWQRLRTTPLLGEPNRCIVCQKVLTGDPDDHQDSCIDALCPPPSPASQSDSIEHSLPPELRKYAHYLRDAHVHCLSDLPSQSDALDFFLRFSCNIEALGVRKKLSAHIIQLGSQRQLPDENLVVDHSNHQKVGAHLSNGPDGRSSVVGPRHDIPSAHRPCKGSNPRPCSVWDSFCPKGSPLLDKGAPCGNTVPTVLVSRKKSQRSATHAGRESAPRKHAYSKRVPGTSFVVDSFRAAGSDHCTRYFLSHFHADHYETLRKKTLPQGSLVLCSSITASLVHSVLNVPKERIQILPSDGKTAVDVDDPTQPGNGVSVRSLHANHCPGAIMFLFYVWKTKRYVLHTGDCRFDQALFSRNETLAELVARKQLDYLYLDTTYADPRYSFPPQNDIISAVVKAAQREDERTKHRCLFFFGTYSIGKEKVFLAVAEALDLHIFADNRKRKILQQLQLGSSVYARLVSAPGQARVHVVSMSSLSSDGLKLYSKRSGLNRSYVGLGLAIVFKPTGWTFQGTRSTATDGIGGVQRTIRGTDQAVLYDVAYSEHSSFNELRSFVAWACPARLIPTVNVRSSQDAEKLKRLLGFSDRHLRIIG